MHNSDDYFDDDIVFDEQTLAVLDQEEHKFAQSSRPLQNPPPPKRQKTNNGWKAGGSRVDSFDDPEDLPEISVQDDGSYGLGGYRAVNGANTTWRREVVNSHSSGPGHPGHTLNASATPPVRSAQHIPVHATGRAPSSYGPSSQNLSHIPQGQTSLRDIFVPPGPQLSRPTEVQAAEELRKQMEELHKDNLKMKAALQEALDIRLAKEGEVSILRQSMHKTNQDHAAQVAKLRAAKEEADAKQAQVRREMKEDMERLRTQFIFKQHEIETSVRKPPWSVRSKKIARDFPSTPFPIPSQMCGWGQGGIDTAGPSKFGSETPRRHHDVSPKVALSRHVDALENVKKSGMLPGFQNAFMPSSPVRSSQTRDGKGKEREVYSDSMGKGKRISFLKYPSQFASDLPPPSSPPSSPTLQRARAARADVNMREVSYDRDAPSGNLEEEDIEMIEDGSDMMSLETQDEFEPINWRAELPRIVLTHSLPSTTSLTIQTLIAATLPTSLPASATNVYSSACSRVLEIIAAISKCHDWKDNADSLVSSLIKMARILNIAHLIRPLTALLNLLITLAFSIPDFSSSLLSRSQDGDIDQPSIITLWCDIIQDQLVPRKLSEEVDQDLMALGRETVGLIEALCWNIPDEFIEKLALILRSRKVLSILLNSSQQSSFLNRSTRLLVILASHQSLFHHLLAFPDPGTNEEQADRNFSQIPHIEVLCSYLVDDALRGEEAESTRIHILMFFAMLSISHSDALAILLESQALIPSLVLFLFHLTTPLWEGDEMLMAAPDSIASSIRTVNQAVFLLHHLVFSSVPVFNLRHTLHYTPHYQFNGLTHMFIVTFGRLSYADPPDWVDLSGKLELEQIAGMARDLLNLVVEGPECDSVWAVYQEEVNEQSDTDDEEMEARYLHSNEI